ncbi:peptidoglycan-binding protein [Funiculus sociatus GB2-M2]|uniref:peptidoglycan-binding domain-containing protein n=1 Tax=Funiculus sociatus TaxID=450527 RepID=UPI0032992911
MQSLAVLSIIFLSPIAQLPAVAQTPNVADGRLNEYTSSSAPTLRRGSRGVPVQDVQLLLRVKGFYSGQIDGVYGPRTYSSIITFQRSRNLPATGITEAQTWESLIDASNRIAPAPATNLSQYSLNDVPVLAIGSQGQAVRDVQAFLKSRGYYTGAVDGIYGRSTSAAVESFQQYNSLSNDGIVGSRTWSALIRAAS